MCQFVFIIILVSEHIHLAVLPMMTSLICIAQSAVFGAN